MMGWKIVSRPNYKWCVRAKAHLTVRGIDFEEELLATREEQLAFKARSRFDTFPQIWKGEEHVGGFADLKIEMP